ncbi:hypothetical protein POREN0001_0389 [Porphyromonas endodontalis ATCC 35406]|uniref:Uncharacterized protein n=1 Tax=Porphyromonas endodontalis (strain ATCC 35406 / DSM 24491 / JCM 8526 / CCUG 16442 / BCRC 14492 / NCTC 13058 / HG 370) TaxID=553175 RepID=C3JAZ7_POREA|nr:hypothetical protein POREN0001_0389 [Porphyromonas endodontalis ATCC 35406]
MTDSLMRDKYDLLIIVISFIKYHGKCARVSVARIDRF